VHLVSLSYKPCTLWYHPTLAVRSNRSSDRFLFSINQELILSKQKQFPDFDFWLIFSRQICSKQLAQVHKFVNTHCNFVAFFSINCIKLVLVMVLALSVSQMFTSDFKQMSSDEIRPLLLPHYKGCVAKTFPWLHKFPTFMSFPRLVEYCQAFPSPFLHSLTFPGFQIFEKKRLTLSNVHHSTTMPQ